MNFIFINSDSFRRDNLSCYGNDWVKTPNLDKFAEEAVVFDRAYCGSFPTVPNRRDVFTGRYTFVYADWSALSSQETVLSEVLGRNGYTSYMVLDTPHIVANGFGYDRGFTGWNWVRGQESDRYRTHPKDIKLPCAVEKLRGGAVTTTRHMRNNTVHRKSEADCFAPMTMSDAIDWLDHNHKLDKFFLYVDTFDPHEPWDPPKHYADMYDPGYNGEEVVYPLYAPSTFLTDAELAHIKALYAGEVTMVDAWVGKLLKKIEDLGLYDNTLVIFTADHGFYFGEHGIIGKFGMIYDELAHIPLMMRMPGAKPGHRSQFVQPCDHMPTMLDLAGVPHPPTVQGKSLVNVLKGSDEPVRDSAVTSWAVIHPPLSETPFKLDASNWNDYARRLKSSSLVTDKWTLATGAGDVRSELFDNHKDPHQTINVIESNKPAAEEMHGKYLKLLESLSTDPAFVERRRKLV